jgi:hypothetical protein
VTTMTFDKLAYIDRLKAAGFAEPQARAMADGLDQALREEVATKSDVAALGNEIGLIRNVIDLLRVEFKSDLGMLKGEFKAELGGLRGELLTAMKADKVDFLKWLMMLIVGQTAVFTALKLLGH